MAAECSVAVAGRNYRRSDAKTSARCCPLFGAVQPCGERLDCHAAVLLRGAETYRRRPKTEARPFSYRVIVNRSVRTIVPERRSAKYRPLASDRESTAIVVRPAGSLPVNGAATVRPYLS